MRGSPGGKAAAQEHLHSAPGTIVSAAGQPARRRLEKLAHPCSLDSQHQPDNGARRSARTEPGAGAEGADHFIVAHVNDPDVAVLGGAVADDGKNDMGVDGGDSGIDDFELSVRKALLEQDFHVATGAECRLWVAHGG